MIPIEMQSYCREINQLLETAKAQQDDEVKNYFARFICIRISGYIEFSIRTCLGVLIDKKSSKEAQAFARWNIRQFQNAQSDKISDFVSRFDDSIKKKIDLLFSENDDIKEAFNSIVGLRHVLAHGGGGGIGLKTCKDYWDLIEIGVDRIYSIINRMFFLGHS